MLNPEELIKLARMLGDASESELDCDECFERLDRFVETELAGLDAATAMPLVRRHLDHCGDCREEYRALHDALGASEGSEPVSVLWMLLRRLLFGG